MQSSKILWGQVITVLLIVIAAVWGATQWTAAALGYQPELGPPWFHLGGYPLYPPPAFFWWWFSYDAYAPDIFVTGAFIASSGGILAFAVAIAMSVWRARERKAAETYGSARWATPGEVAGAGLLGEDGVVLGRLGRDYLRHDGPEHVLCFAPTRSGKGDGLVIPSLLTWHGSAIVHDIKGENWTLTAGFRARVGKVLLFDPTNPASAAYNPLIEVRKGAWEVRDVQNVADVLVDPVINTDRRTYHLELRATSDTYMASVSWTYPQDALIALAARNREAIAAAPAVAGVDLDALNFAYRIEGDRPAWRPLRAFDDGHQVFIELPATIGQGDLPPLFVAGAKGQGELVNYRLRGRYLVVDRLFNGAELRLGAGKSEQRVRVLRDAGKGKEKRK